MMDSKKIKKIRMKEFGEFLKSLRIKKNNVSVREVAKAIGVSDPYLYQVEAGQKALTDPDFFNRLAEYFNIPVQELLTKAGYIGDSSEEKMKIEKAYDKVITHPKFTHKSDLNGKDLDSDVKRVLIELFQESTGEKILE